MGPKFSFYTEVRDEGLRKYLIVFEKLKDKINNFMDMNIFKKKTSKFHLKFTTNSFRDRSNVQTKAQKFINYQRTKTLVFLKSNPNVKIFPADKGGRIVITDLQTYRTKMTSHLYQNVKLGVYRHLKGLSFDYVRDLCESKYERIRDAVNMIFSADVSLGFKSLCKHLAFELFIISRIYGCFKVYKEDCPARPIVSSTDCMAKPLSKWLLSMLDHIASHVSVHQVRSGNDLFNKIINVKVKNNNHILVTWDFDNMFTNIPFSKTKVIIIEYYHLIQKHTSMPCELFLDCLSFIVEETSFFTFEDEIYLRMEGLAMGNSLSQILAEISTSYYLNKALLSFRDDEITFIYQVCRRYNFCHR